MRYRYFFALLHMAIPMVGFSQIEVTDSIATAPQQLDSGEVATAVRPDSSISIVGNAVEYHQKYNPVSNFLFHQMIGYPRELHIPDPHFIPGTARLIDWKNGAVIASGGTTLLPGLMQVDNGALNIYQSIGDFTFHAGGMVNKYGYFNGLHSQYGLQGGVTYRFTPNLSATVFGNYYFGKPPRMSNGIPMSPSMIGFYGRSTYGVSLDYQVNDHWGVVTGIQTVEQVGTNKHQAEPIVTPYYKINKKIAIGLPVGQILYHILKKR